MCGICGVIGAQSRDASETATRRMMAAMRHRGPDDEGILIAPPVAVGMGRLSIIDLPGGGQPVWNEDESLAVVYNGEIYNFRELREELQALGHQFRTRSDTEVIVHAYQAWGEGCVRRLDGMFAFCVVELTRGSPSPARRIFLARDRLGIKPLYYAKVGGSLYFASEVRALLATGLVSAELCPETVSAYLLFGSACEPLTLVEGVRSLPPGHSISISLGEPRERPDPAPYWSAPQSPNPAHRADDSSKLRPFEAAQTVRALLESAVASHLVADVPVGVFLSSGLDSTAIAALASQARSGVHTFTVAFADRESSEAEIARRTAKRLGTEHLEVMLSEGQMVARLDEAVEAFDQPSMDGVNTYFVSWAARQAGLKVALSGLGSDELFGGYESFRATPVASRAAAVARRLPPSLAALAARAMARVGGLGSSPDRLRKASAALGDRESLPHPYFFTRLLFTPQVINCHSRLGSSALRDTPWWGWLADAAEQAHSLDHFAAISWLELRSYLLNTLLRDTDAMSMRNSLEVRVPFLDTPLVDCVLSLPERAKLGSRPKALLVAALGDVLPPEVVSQTKRTFTFPWENWLRGPLGNHVAAGLADWSPRLEPHVSNGLPRAVWRDFLGGRTSWSRPWSLYVLNEWTKRNLASARAGNSDCRTPAALA